MNLIKIKKYLPLVVSLMMLIFFSIAMIFMIIERGKIAFYFIILGLIVGIGGLFAILYLFYAKK